MKLETISTKANLTSLKRVTIQEQLSKSVLANSDHPVGQILIETKQKLAMLLAAQILSGHLAEFTIHDDKDAETIILTCTAYVAPPTKVRNAEKESISVPDKNLIVPGNLRR